MSYLKPWNYLFVLPLEFLLFSHGLLNLQLKHRSDGERLWAIKQTFRPSNEVDSPSEWFPRNWVEVVRSSGAVSVFRLLAGGAGEAEQRKNWLHLISSLKQIVLPCFAEATNSEPSCLQSLSLSAILPKSFASCSYHGTLWKGERRKANLCISKSISFEWKVWEFRWMAAPRAGGLIASYFRLAQVGKKWKM